jgi:nitrate/nitrite transport system substrate-binding protein
MSNVSRCRFLWTAGATTAAAVFAHGCSSGNQSNSSEEIAPANDAGSIAPTPTADIAPPEVPTAKLGFIALTDSAPLIIAKEQGILPNTVCPMSR